jgi:hypothetical protein
MRIEANIGTGYWAAPKGKAHGSFRPNGKLLVVGPEVANANLAPRWSTSGGMWSARIFVGFNVGGKARWDIDDLIKVVKRVRKKQERSPDASFVAQKGIYTSTATGTTVEENGAQVIILNTAGAKAKDFVAEMLALAEEIARALKQEEVIMEIQRAGLVKKTYGVGP